MTTISIAVVLAGIIGYTTSIKGSSGTTIFSPKTMLANSWERYKEHYIDEDTGRVFDRQRNDITTSEGQSYAMLRAVWINDKDVFDITWEWTKNNLEREDDNLFAWLYGERENGTDGILEEQDGMNTASDADTDIALALLLAYARWGDHDYLQEASAIIGDIWEKEVVTINGRPYLSASNVDNEEVNPYIVVNPSYFAPYAYRIFQEIDPHNDWMSLVDTSYDVIEKSLEAPFETTISDEAMSRTGEGGRVPSDWIAINRTSGEIVPAEGHSVNFGFDAMRVPWRIAMDWMWFESEEARKTMELMSFFEKEWVENEVIFASYTHDGFRTVDYQAPAVYGGTIGYFMVSDPSLADEIYKNKLKPLYNPDINDWEERLNYYDDNWAWFGIAMYHDLLPNIWKNI